MSSSAQMQLPVVGGWKPVDPRTEKIQELAKWAVNEENKKPSAYKLAYKEAFYAEEQLVAGMNYRIDFEAYINIFPGPAAEAGNKRRVGKFQAIIYEDLKGNLELTKFSPLLQANEKIAVAN
ncbi:unnamed protein product [Amaranthus hypochondriacus]